MLQTVEQETGASPQWSVIWLHGLGADGHDFAPIVPELVRPHWPALRFVFPHAPVRPITINNGVPMRGWYDIVGMDFAQRADKVGAGHRKSGSNSGPHRDAPKDNRARHGFGQSSHVIGEAGDGGRGVHFRGPVARAFEACPALRGHARHRLCHLPCIAA